MKYSGKCRDVACHVWLKLTGVITRNESGNSTVFPQTWHATSLHSSGIPQTWHALHFSSDVARHVPTLVRPISSSQDSDVARHVPTWGDDFDVLSIDYQLFSIFISSSQFQIQSKICENNSQLIPDSCLIIKILGTTIAIRNAGAENLMGNLKNF
ncbi:MAG: hypothetical protein HDS87_03150 [Bacteroidales bacterium]|nr:hypothetical protein [Bacteroidales bacterium]